MSERSSRCRKSAHRKSGWKPKSTVAGKAVFRDAKMTTARLDRLTHHCKIIETVNHSGSTELKRPEFELRRQDPFFNFSVSSSHFELAKCLQICGQF
jgi:IstB-like ATP binding protein